MILNAKAENGSLKSALRVIFSPVFGSVPSVGGMSSGLGR